MAFIDTKFNILYLELRTRAKNTIKFIIIAMIPQLTFMGDASLNMIPFK